MNENKCECSGRIKKRGDDIKNGKEETVDELVQVIQRLMK